MRFLAVKNFERYQHYKDRSPPWIKLYRDLLLDMEFVRLPEAAQAQLVKIWLVASTCGNQIPWDNRVVSQAIKAGKRLYLDELIASGFLYECLQDASAPLAESEQNASPSRARPRGREEERGERPEKEPPPHNPTTAAAARARAGQPGRAQLLAVLSATRRHGMEQTLAMLARGEHLPAGLGVPTPEQIDTTCIELLAAVEPASLSPKALRRFLIRTMRGEDDAPGSTRRNDTPSMVARLLNLPTEGR